MLAALQTSLALNVFQGCLNTFLVALCAGLMLSPEHLARARRWLARLRERRN